MIFLKQRLTFWSLWKLLLTAVFSRHCPVPFPGGVWLLAELRMRCGDPGHRSGHNHNCHLAGYYTNHPRHLNINILNISVQCRSHYNNMMYNDNFTSLTYRWPPSTIPSHQSDLGTISYLEYSTVNVNTILSWPAAPALRIVPPWHYWLWNI